MNKKSKPILWMFLELTRTCNANIRIAGDGLHYEVFEGKSKDYVIVFFHEKVYENH